MQITSNNVSSAHHVRIRSKCSIRIAHAGVLPAQQRLSLLNSSACNVAA